MTPREPDRFDKRALELYRYCKREMGTDQPASYDCPHPSVDDVAAALRAEAAEALERAAQLLRAEVTNEERYGMAQAAFSEAEDMVRDLIPSAAAPAAETGKAQWVEASDLRAMLARGIADAEGYVQIERLQGDTEMASFHAGRRAAYQQLDAALDRLAARATPQSGGGE